MTSATPDGWTITDFSGCSTFWTTLTAPQQAYALRLATFTVYALTGRQFGTVTATLRPCNPGALPPLYQTYPVGVFGSWGSGEGASSGAFPVYLLNGVWHNGGCGGYSCGGTWSEVELPRTVSISSVVIDGATLSPSAYRIDNGDLLVRTDGGYWPRCQDIGKNPGVTNTWTVTGAFGRVVPQEALDAASLLACEVGKSIAGQPCRLPQRMQSLTRQGVSVQFPAVNSYLDRGLTGLNEVDQLVVQLNPNRLTQSPKVLSMDSSPIRISTWP